VVAPGGGKRMSYKIPLVYILAASHSGSTLLAMLLGSHPEVCTVGELKATNLGDPDRYRCSCRELIRKCLFWTGISHDLALRGFPFDIVRAGTHFDVESAYAHRLLRPLHRGTILEAIRDTALALSPTWRRELPRIQSLNAALAECILARTGKRVLVDSSKIGLRLKYLLRNPALDVRVIRLIRDGRAVALTYTDPARYADASDPALRGGGTGSSRDGERLPLARAAREWRRGNEEADAILRRLPHSRWTEVRYEALCARPDETLHRVLTFLGLTSASVWRDFRSVEHHVIGNGMRLDSNEAIRLDNSWVSALSPRDLDLFDSLAGDVNRRLGYA
jgi:sulfotransferase family protein